MRAPRRFACSYSSSATAPAPSPSTKPSRSLSHGRLAAAGSSLRVESARAEAKPPTASRSEEHTSELQSQSNLVCRLLLEKKTKQHKHADNQQCNYQSAALLRHNTAPSTYVPFFF